MKIIECEQGGAAWFDARMGMPTASEFESFITLSGELREGITPRNYMLELLGERLTRRPADHWFSKAMERGIELEPRARAWYEIASGRGVREVGFVVHDSGLCGASPDGLCEDRGIEIKCPLTPTFLHIAESRVLPAAHALQVQAGMWITGLPEWDYVIWTDVPGLEPQIITVQAKEWLHKGFAKIIPEFCAWLDETERKMRAAGHGKLPQPEEPPTWAELVQGGTTI